MRAAQSAAPPPPHPAPPAEAPSPGAAPPAKEGGALVAHTEGFVASLKLLMADLCRRFPQDALVDRMRKRISLAADVCPTTLVELVGSHLYPYREQIYGENADFFLDSEFREEYARATDDEKVAIAVHVVPKVKQAWREAGPEEREAYAEAVQGLLDDYIEYLSIQVEVAAA